MRHSGSVLALLFVVVASGAARAQPTRPVVVLVHGRGHLGDDSASLRRTWKRDLDMALASAGMAPLADAELRLAWYADVMNLEAEVDGQCAAARRTQDTLNFAALAGEFLVSLVSALPKDSTREFRALMGDLLYVADRSRRCSAEQRVGRVIEGIAAEGRPVILVAYSLGSLVTYGYLHSRASWRPAADIRLITMGSPLGSPELRDILGQGTASLRLPRGVSGWDNIYDPDDALSSNLEPDFPGDSAPVRDHLLESDWNGETHYIGRYLRDRATGRALARALCASTGNQADKACGGIPR